MNACVLSGRAIIVAGGGVAWGRADLCAGRGGALRRFTTSSNTGNDFTDCDGAKQV